MDGYYDRSGNVISFEEYVRLHSPEYQRVLLTEYGDVKVSTVWLGIDHRFGFGDEPSPIIFETMVFGGERDEWHWRYATEQEARAGHAEVCSVVFRDVQLV
jgi:hypothetical protein